MLDPALPIHLGFFDLLGVVGAGLYICNYTLLVMRRFTADHPGYFVVNLLAAGLVLLSLTHAFNLGAALIQFFFLVMSIAGIVSRLHPVRRLRRLRSQPAPVAQPIRWSRPGVDIRRG